jgi:hypothetical protein
VKIGSGTKQQQNKGKLERKKEDKETEGMKGKKKKKGLSNNRLKGIK